MMDFGIAWRVINRDFKRVGDGLGSESSTGLGRSNLIPSWKWPE